MPRKGRSIGGAAHHHQPAQSYEGRGNQYMVVYLPELSEKARTPSLVPRPKVFKERATLKGSLPSIPDEKKRRDQGLVPLGRHIG